MPRKSKDQVIDAAINTFMRYGFRRVTMAELAEDAGISRPTLYAFFPNKEELFRAAATRMTKNILQAVRDLAREPGSLSEQLQGVFEIWAVQNFEIVNRSPDARDLLESTQTFNLDVVEQAFAEFEDVLGGLLRTHGLSKKKACIVARTLTASAQGIKESARNVEDLRELLTALIDLTVAGLEVPYQ